MPDLGQYCDQLGAKRVFIGRAFLLLTTTYPCCLFPQPEHHHFRRPNALSATDMTPAVSRPPDDDEVQPYVITNEIGKGSFATVYRGYHSVSLPFFAILQPLMPASRRHVELWSTLR